MDLKKHASFTQQVQKLIDRGLKISDREEAEKLLSCINYYRLTGYLHDFKVPNSDKYKEGITLEQIKSIYDFDKKLNRILMYALEDIEETLKTRLSYCVTSHFPDDPLVYLKSDIYSSYSEYTKFQTLFFKTVEQNKKLPFVKHHNEVYGGKLPMWVAVELFTMGNLHAVYDNLLPTYQKEIARMYHTGKVQLSNWIENLTYTRNHLAHYMRIYKFNFGRTPAECRNHPRLFTPSHKIFDQIYIMSCLYSDPTEWKNYVVLEIKALLEQYAGNIQISDLGFPEKWEKILT